MTVSDGPVSKGMVDQQEPWEKVIDTLEYHKDLSNDDDLIAFNNRCQSSSTYFLFTVLFPLHVLHVQDRNI